MRLFRGKGGVSTHFEQVLLPALRQQPMSFAINANQSFPLCSCVVALPAGGVDHRQRAGPHVGFESAARARSLNTASVYFGGPVHRHTAGGFRHQGGGRMAQTPGTCPEVSAPHNAVHSFMCLDRHAHGTTTSEPPPSPPPRGVVFKLVTLFVVVLNRACTNLAVDMESHVDGARGAAARRQRRLRAQWRREQQSVAIALAAALHSSGASTKKVVERRERQEEEVHVTHVAPRGQKAPPPGTRPGLLTEPAPQERLEAAARVSEVGALPTLGLPVLAGASGRGRGPHRPPLPRGQCA